MRPARRLEASREEAAWGLLRALARGASAGHPILHRTGLQLDDQGQLSPVAERDAFVVARPELASGWSSERALDPASRALLDLYMPLCVGERSATLVVAHLGQSADGHTAAISCTSKFITGSADILHNHRLRALCDVVLVGARTVEIDDPLLTTRLVSGQSPVRVILDPNARLQEPRAVFDNRGAPTLVAIASERRCALPSHVETFQVRRSRDGIELPDLLRQLRARGLSRVFIEGGAVTVSHFLRAGLLDRLQLAVAPLRLGPAPVPPSPAPGPDELARICSRVRRFSLGDDVLFDGELKRDNP
jgi:diaminohydroxyphosphoribosylaminopyrimidine deaminase / 5-amino-6-(5-phosphoribosylamino)uracil reductase